MNILFISYAEVSLRRGSMRSAAMLHALADAGYRVDLLAPRSDLPDHPHIHVLVEGEGGRPVRRARLRLAGLHAVLRGSYAAVHAADEAVFFSMRLCRWRKIPLLYDAARCFSGRAACKTFWPGRIFPKHVQRLETKALERAIIVFSPCSALTADLRALNGDARVMQLEDIPAQPLYARRSTDKSMLPERPDRKAGPVVVCSALPGHSLECRTLLVAARKVIETIPDALFFFRGISSGKAGKITANLDIVKNCVFLPDDEPEPFLSALESAAAVVMIPPGGGRYIHPEVYSLLQAAAPLVTIHDSSYDEVLTDKTSVRLLPNSESIAEGLLRVIQEPLFSLAVALEGQQLVADHHSYSSFNHQLRMVYRDLANASS